MKWYNKKPSGRTVSIFIDAEKAFDTVWHNGLRKMMHEAKIPTEIIRLISSFLNNRKGCVKVNEHFSREVELTAGVPQGSLLSPIIYIYFTRNMPTIAINETTHNKSVNGFLFLIMTFKHPP